MARPFGVSRSTLSVACGLVLVLTCGAAGQVTFDLDYDAYPHEAPSWDPHGTHLTVLMQAAAVVWGDIIRDSHEIRIQYQYEELDSGAASTVWHTSAKHYFDTNNNGVNDSSVERVTNCTIRVDPRIAWFVDPTPLDHSEFTNPTQLLSRDLTPDQLADAYADSPPDLLESAFFLEPITGPGAPLGRDLFTTVLHEFGHALGLNESSNDSDPPYRLPSDMVWGESVFAHSERGHGDQNRNHIDTHRALMSYNRLDANRTLPSATDVMVMAEFCRWTQIDMPRKDFVQVGATAYWDHSRHWTGNRSPDADDDVFIRSGADCILHQPGEARSLLIDENSRLTIMGNQVLRLAELDVGPTGVLEIAWSGSRVEIIDPATGTPLPAPDVWINGSLELTQQANQSFGRLTIADEDPVAGPTPHLYMDDHSTLTLANNLRLLGGTESHLSRSDIVFTDDTGSLLELNGPMTLEDESNVSVRSLVMAETADVSAHLSLLSGSTFTITDDAPTAETIIPVSGSLEVRNAGSRLTVAGDLRADGALTINHAAGVHLGGLSVEDSGSLSLRFGGLLDASDPGGLVHLHKGADVTISDPGTRLLADRLVLNDSVDINGGARLDTSSVLVNVLFGSVAPVTMQLNGAGEVLTTQELALRTVAGNMAGTVQNSGLVTVHGDLQAEGEGVAFYTLQDGELHVNRLSLLESSSLEFNLNGGSLHLGEVHREATASLILNLNGAEVALTSAAPLALDVVRVASGSAMDVDQEMPNHEISMQSLSVGYAGTGRLTLRGPVQIGETMIVGDQSYGEFTFAPASEWTTLGAGEIQIGRDGRGVFVQTNGFVSVDDADPLQIGRGIYRLEGGRLQTRTTEVGILAGREGSFVLQGGRHEVSELRIGMGGASALYEINSGMLDAHDVFVAADHAGQLFQNGGTAEIGGDLLLGSTHAQAGIVELNAGRMTVAGRLQIAHAASGRGTFTHRGGDLTVRDDLIVGHGEDSIARFDGYGSLDVLGNVLVGAGYNAQADLRIEGSPGAYPTLDVGGSIHVAGGAGSRADMYIIGSGFTGPTVWLTDGDVQIGAGGTGTLHMAGGRIRAIARPEGGYDSQLVLHPAGSLRGYGQVDIPLANNGGVINATAIPLAFMSKISGNGLYQTVRDVNTFQSGRIEFWGGGEIHGAVLSDGTVSVLGSADALQVYGDINGAGEFEVVGVADVYGNMKVANVRVRGTLSQQAGASEPGLLHISMGTYTMLGGTLETTSPVVAGTLEQTGGSILIHEDLRIGPDPAGYSYMGGSLVLSDGVLRVTGDLHVGAESEYGMPSSGALKFTSEKPHVTVEGDLYLTASGRIEAVENASITLTGSSVYNSSQNPASMAALAGMTLRFRADGSVLDTFEVAGDSQAALDDTFAIGLLDVGMETRLQLVDRIDNGNWLAGEREVLFLHDLLIADTASLDTNGLGLCIEHDVLATIEAWMEDSRLFDGSGLVLESYYDATRDLTYVQPVPEPTTAVMLSCCVLVLLGRRTFRRRLPL